MAYDGCLIWSMPCVRRLMTFSAVQDTLPWMAVQKLGELDTRSHGRSSMQNSCATAFQLLCSRYSTAAQRKLGCSLCTGVVRACEQ